MGFESVIGLSSGFASLVSLTCESTSSLCQTIKSFKSKEREVRALRDEAQALTSVLTTLHDSIGNMAEGVGILEQPLKRCRNACKEFQTLIKESTEHSSDEQTSIKDWLTLRYMGEDIIGFKNMLAGYKSTITIALVFNNIQETRNTKDVLDEYKELIETTKYDLEVHLQDIKKLQQSGIAEGRMASKFDASELQRMEEESESIQHCVKICTDYSAQLEKMARSPLPTAIASSSDIFNASSALAEPGLPWLIVAEAVNASQKEFVSSKLRLQQYSHSLNGQARTFQYRLPRPPVEKMPEQIFEEEVDSIADSLSLCDSAANQENDLRRNFYEDVSVGDDSQQAIVSIRDLLTVKRVKAGDRATQVMGQFSGASLESFSRGHYHSTDQKGK